MLSIIIDHPKCMTNAETACKKIILSRVLHLLGLSRAIYNRRGSSGTRSIALGTCLPFDLVMQHGNFQRDLLSFLLQTASLKLWIYNLQLLVFTDKLLHSLSRRLQVLCTKRYETSPNYGILLIKYSRCVPSSIISCICILHGGHL